MKPLFAFLIILVTAGCEKQPETTTSTSQETVRSVKFIKSVFESHTQYRELTGVVRSAQTSPISFKVNGTVSHVLVTKGQRVEKGQVLAQLETSDLLLALRKAQASLGAAKAARLQAEDKYTRSATLNEKSFVSDSELSGIKADFDAKQQQENLALTDLSNAELNLERAKLFAPFSGQISQVFIDNYTKVNSGQKIIELVNDFAYEVDFLVPESLIGQVEFGAMVQVVIPALNNTVFMGQISEIGAVVQKGNAYAVTLLLQEPIETLRNGMSANIQFNIGSTSQNVVMLPLEAFDFGDKSHSGSKDSAAIYIVSPDDMTLEKRYVQTKNNINSKVVVLSNLDEGEIVVTAGIPYLYEGQKVALWEGL
ncbi:MULTISPECIES: efflux RND transporter periplasmic adaptor subunit [Vibrio]|uniref:efflux RND transporter periplasmic adaptor subunit n=1 Tax=Vibrio TaxID=662 RepID=UPI00142EC770|nr:MULTISPECIES: efflux RND transporter periplasmic adaptor subunit [Vibrio]